MFFRSSAAGSLPLQFMMGFFLLDLAVIIVNREHYGRKSVIEYTGHHVISLTGFYLAVKHQGKCNLSMARRRAMIC